MRLLVVNAGSSSLKLRLVEDDDTISHHADLPADAEGFRLADLHRALADWPRPDAVGHRIVHGGPNLTRAVWITAGVEAELRDLVELAPLHQPRSLAALDAVRGIFPDVPAAACFDTAFHATIPPAAATYAVPAEWRERWRIRRYGFHGLSHAYCSRRAAQLTGRPSLGLRVVTCHLGAGASLAAVVDGCSVDTTMGFTPLEGLVMATRCGSIDPGLVLWLEEHEKLTPHEVAFALEHRSGLTALAGTGDMSVIERRAAAGESAAGAALDIYVHRAAGAVGAMAVAAGGLDVLVFTAGVGEHSPGVRKAVAERLAFLGVAVCAERNRTASGDADISSAAAAVTTLVLAAREDLQIAHELRLLRTGAPRIPSRGGATTPCG